MDNGKQTQVTLEKIGKMPMPIDLIVTTKKGEVFRHIIPLRMMRGVKSEAMNGVTTKVEEDWPWVYPSYQLTLDLKLKDIEKIEIDPSKRMADVNQTNNQYPPLNNTTVIN